MPESFPTLFSGLSMSEPSSSSAASEAESPPSLSHFASFLERLSPIIEQLHHSTHPDIPPIESLLSSLRSRLQQLISSYDGSPASIKPIENCSHEIGRCLGLLLVVSWATTDDTREEVRLLQRDMMPSRFNCGITESGGDGVVPDLEDVLVRVKRGEDEENPTALLELRLLLRRGLEGDEESSNVISALLQRLGSARLGERLNIILLLRSLAYQSDHNKENMADVQSLSTIVRSLTRNVDESREAVGLLADLSVIPKVRQRIGRIQGCIVMLVTLSNGEDLRASCDAGKLLIALSNNTQNVLLMAEAGYFVPLVQYIKEGSDMNKILMATAISRMQLTDQMRATLGIEGCIKPLVQMYISGKLEAKQSALGALRNLSRLRENIPLLINAGIVRPLLQLLFSVTSVLVTLQEPASAILASIAQSPSILKHKNVAPQMLSLLNLSSPLIQLHLLQALNSIVSHPKSKRVRAKMNESGAVQLLLPFLIESNTSIRTIALNLLFNLSKDLGGEVTELFGETHLNILVGIISTTASENEKAAATAILSNIPLNDSKATEVLSRANLLPLLLSLLGGCSSADAFLCSTRMWLAESIAGILIRFTIPSDKKLQRASVSHGIIPFLVKLLSDGSPIAKFRAATALAQLSQNSLSLSKVKSSRWLCVMQSSESFCELHNGHCSVKETFCLVKAGAVAPLVRVLEGKEREADEAVLNALATLMQDELWEKGGQVIEKASGVQAIIRILEVGGLIAQERAVWMMERIFSCADHREKYGAVAQVVLIDLAQKGHPTLKPSIAKILAHLQLLQMQSSYF